MAEALGAAASLVQLADVTIRTSLGLYTFFSALYKAEPEFHRHIIVLRDVHDAIQLLRKVVVASPERSILAQDDAAILKRQLGSLTDELSSLDKVTAGKDPSKLATRLKWVLKSPDVDRALQNLERHKTSLLILLHTVDLGKSAQLLRSQHDAMNRLGSLESQLEQNNRNGNAMRTEMGTMLDRVVASMNANHEFYQQSLQDGFSNLHRGIETSEAHILRQVLEIHLLPYLKRETQELNAAATQEFRTILNETASQFRAHLTRIEERSDSDIEALKEPRMAVEHQSTPQSTNQSWIAARPLSDGVQNDTQLPVTTVSTNPFQVPPHRPTKATEWSHWGKIPRIGTFRVEYAVETEPRGRFYTFRISFWPSTILFCRRGFSLKYSNRPDREGYASICPSLMTYRVLSRDNPIWDLIRYDDVHGVIERFQTQSNGPFEVEEHGASLLMVAALCSSYRTIQFLLSQGANPAQAAEFGENSLDALVHRQVWDAVIVSRSSCGHLRRNDLDLASFSSTFRSFTAAGCDLDDCSITIYDYMLLNQFKIISSIMHPQDRIALSGYQFKRISSIMHPQDRIALSGMDPSSGSYNLRRGDCSDNCQDFHEDQYLTNIKDLSEFLSRQGHSLLHEPDESEDVFLELVLTFPCRMTLPVLQACGLTSNFLLPNPQWQWYRPLIYSALYPFIVANSNHDKAGATRRYREVHMRNLVDLLINGANVFEIDWADGYLIDYIEDGIMSPTVHAQAYGIMPEWLEALAAAGYDPDHVIWEDERRRREFLWLHGAKSSSVDVQDNHTQNSIRRRATRTTVD